MEAGDGCEVRRGHLPRDADSFQKLEKFKGTDSPPGSLGRTSPADTCRHPVKRISNCESVFVMFSVIKFVTAAMVSECITLAHFVWLMWQPSLQIHSQTGKVEKQWVCKAKHPFRDTLQVTLYDRPMRCHLCFGRGQLAFILFSQASFLWLEGNSDTFFPTEVLRK